ncbi:MAG: hypothetical protein Q8M08_01835 [Bacteroidales bacterium]|nr:hypothetical protein [Bacteroidales bacterium]
MKQENSFSRKIIFAGIVALFLLAVFILVNYYLSLRNLHQTTDPRAGVVREKLPVALEGKGKRLAFHDFESGNPADTSSHLAIPGHGGKQALKVSKGNQFSPGLWIKFKDLNPGDSSWIRATGWIRFSCKPSEVKCNLVVTCNHNGINYKYIYISLENENLVTGQWNRVSIDYYIPQAPDREDVLQAYFWYRGMGEVLVDDIDIEYYTY